MARRKREPMSEGKKNIIADLIEEYDIRTAKDIEDALRDLMGGTIQEMLETELDEHLGYRSYERSDSSNYRNGKKTKKIRGNLGETKIEVPQDLLGDGWNPTSCKAAKILRSGCRRTLRFIILVGNVSSVIDNFKMSYCT